MIGVQLQHNGVIMIQKLMILQISISVLINHNKNLNNNNNKLFNKQKPQQFGMFLIKNQIIMLMLIIIILKYLLHKLYKINNKTIITKIGLVQIGFNNLKLNNNNNYLNNNNFNKIINTFNNNNNNNKSKSNKIKVELKDRQFGI